MTELPAQSSEFHTKKRRKRENGSGSALQNPGWSEGCRYFFNRDYGSGIAAYGDWEDGC